jgi:hypothetical protein
MVLFRPISNSALNMRATSARYVEKGSVKAEMRIDDHHPSRGGSFPLYQAARREKGENDAKGWP